MLNEKGMKLHLITGLIKKRLYKMIQTIWVKPYKSFGVNINVKVDLSNYATKADLKDATGIDTSNLAAKSDIVSLKAKLDKIDIVTLKPAPADLSKLSNVVNNGIVKILYMIK